MDIWGVGSRARDAARARRSGWRDPDRSELGGGEALMGGPFSWVGSGKIVGFYVARNPEVAADGADATAWRLRFV